MSTRLGRNPPQGPPSSKKLLVQLPFQFINVEEKIDEFPHIYVAQKFTKNAKIVFIS